MVDHRRIRSRRDEEIIEVGVLISDIHSEKFDTADDLRAYVAEQLQAAGAPVKVGNGKYGFECARGKLCIRTCRKGYRRRYIWLPDTMSDLSKCWYEHGVIL